MAKILKGFTIRLSRIPLSEQLSNDCIESGKKYGINIEPFGGINGNVADPILKSLGLRPRREQKKTSKPGVKGCFLSHFFLWQKCIQLNEPIAIFEHDGLLIRQVPEDILNHFTDVLTLDPCDQYSKDYEYCLAHTGPYVFSEYFNYKAKKNTIFGEYLRGAYAYIIKPHAAERIVEQCIKYGFVPADQQIGKKLVDIRSVFPSIARLHPYYNRKRIKLESLTKNLPSL